MVSTKVGKRQEFNDKGKFVINDEDESSICFDEDDDNFKAFSEPNFTQSLIKRSPCESEEKKPENTGSEFLDSAQPSVPNEVDSFMKG